MFSKKIFNHLKHKTLTKFKSIPRQNFSIHKRARTDNILAIDYSTAESYLSVIENSKPKVIDFGNNKFSIPSLVASEGKDGWLVGNSVNEKFNSLHAENIIYAPRRILGKKYHELHLKPEIHAFHYHVTKGRYEDAVFEINKQLFSPEFINGLLLSHLKTAAEARLNTKFEEAVITVPSVFDNISRKALVNAAQIGGLSVVRLLNQPTAAAIGYAFEKNFEEKTFAIYNWNGGFFDIAIVEWCYGVLEVKSSAGGAFLPNDNINVLLQRWIAEAVRADHGVEVPHDKSTTMALVKLADKALKELDSVASELELTLHVKGKDYSVKLSKAKFEELTNKIYLSTLETCRRCLAESGLHKEEISEVLVIGKMRHVGQVHKILETVFGKKPIDVANSDHLIAKGASIEGGILSGKVKEKLILDSNPNTVSIEATGNPPAPFVFRNTVLPTQKELFINDIPNDKPVHVNFFEGENPDIQKNKLVAQYEIKNPQKIQSVGIDCVLESNGLLFMLPKEEALKQGVSIEEVTFSGLSPQEVKELKSKISGM